MAEQRKEGRLPVIEGRWETVEPIPRARSEVTATVLNGRIYVFGGVHKGYTVDNVDVYDVSTGRWTSLSPLPLPLDHTQAVTVDKVIYIIGGSLSATNEIKGDSVAEMMRNTNWDFAPRTATYRYDPVADRYERLSNMPLARLGHSAVAIGRKIFVVGGQGPNPGIMMVYDVDQDRWGFLPGMPSFREHLAIGVIDGRIYTIGGRWPNPLDPEASFMIGQINTAVNESYDSGSKQWASREPMPTPRGAGYGAVLDEKLFVTGGEVLDSPDRLTFADVEAYDPVTNRWWLAPPLPTPRHGLATVEVDGRLYAIAGGPKAAWDQTDIVEVFTPAGR